MIQYEKNKLNQSLEEPLIPKDRWGLDPHLTFLNHGSFGACPLDILAKQQQFQLGMERSPVRFNLTELVPLLNQARERLTSILGCPSDHFCFVSNASEGVMTALNHIQWSAGDEVVMSQDSYPACRHMLTHLADQYKLTIKIAQTPFASMQSDSEWKQEVLDAFQACFTKRTRLVLIDHITSPTALVFPVAELIEITREAGAISLVDGAHAPGQIKLELEKLNPDFYVGNAHKWLMTPKSCAILYVSEAHRSTLMPLVLSHGYLAEASQRFHALFDWVGTKDYSASLCIPDTLDWIEAYCSFDQLRERNYALTQSARSLLVDMIWPDSPPPLPPSQALAQLAAIPLPHSLAHYTQENLMALSGRAAAGHIHPLQQALWAEQIEVPIIETAHGTVLRISAQAYNNLGDYRRLGQVLKKLSQVN